MKHVQVEDFKDVHGKWVRTKRVTIDGEKATYLTRAGSLWGAMVSRCKVSGLVQTAHPTYIGCSNEFIDFQSFTEWARCQYGYTNKNANGKYWSLDKDILIEGNKIYSPETCIFVPAHVNTILNVRRPETTKGFPLGVTTSPTSGDGFLSQCAVGVGKQEYLGFWRTPHEAHQAWQLRKIEHIECVAFAQDREILRGALLKRADNIRQDYLTNQQTTSF